MAIERISKKRRGARIFLVITAMVVAAFVYDVPATEATSQAAENQQPAAPTAGALSQPKSVEQIGFPADATRAPFDNPQTPEKIALGQKLFFDAAGCRPTGPWLAALAMIPPAPSPTATRPRSA